MSNCPTCKWEPPMDGYYYCRNGKAIDCTRHSAQKPIAPQKQNINDILEDMFDSIQVGPYSHGKPPFKHFKCYPRVENYSYSAYASYEFGINGHTWDEIHKCPVCNKEYWFDNSDY